VSIISSPHHRGRNAALVVAVLILGVVSGLALPTVAQAPEDDVAPAPPSIGADVPLTYFGPSPSQVQKELVGPVRLLRSGPVDTEAGTITLPLYRGELRDGRNVWYVLTDTTDKDNAEALGLLHSAKLAYASVGRGTRSATLEKNGVLVFDRGTVDFSPERRIVPGDAPNPFPPKEFEPGAVGDRFYSPLVRIVNAGLHVYNAPIIAFDVGEDALQMPEGEVDHAVVHDKVVSIDVGPNPNDGLATVTIALTAGFSFAKPILYMSLDANHPLPATMEGATLAPGLSDLSVGRDDSAFSALERIFAVVNGPTGKDNPQRQGFNSALMGEGGPLNVAGGIPTVAIDYSPLWDLNVAEWTQEAIDKGYRSRLIDEFQILGMVERGFLTGPGGEDFGSTGFIINCPVVFRFL
jgi:hypothetical protein